MENSLSLAEVDYKVTLKGYWLNYKNRIWESVDGKLYKIDKNNNAKRIDTNEETETIPPSFFEIGF